MKKRWRSNLAGCLWNYETNSDVPSDVWKSDSYPRQRERSSSSESHSCKAGPFCALICAYSNCICITGDCRKETRGFLFPMNSLHWLVLPCSWLLATLSTVQACYISLSLIANMFCSSQVILQQLILYSTYSKYSFYTEYIKGGN